MHFGGPHQIPIRFVPLPTTPTYNATKAALHSFSESLRVQLAGADAGVQVIGVAPPGVRTTLLGQQDDESSMPLDDYLTETLDLLRDKPDAKELVVERARFVRDAAHQAFERGGVVGKHVVTVERSSV
ncbi:SDR family NAD(P)-dependent oxidoreductase [Streptomyces sp. NPDC002766]|uniref:SDR family NAD(P)-dependent oxidoreductase n=1 Tax=Streptomyces sp. NPDC002766 TaxID=3154429 RepID=UPI0033186E22